MPLSPPLPYDQRIARRLVKPLARLGVSPNQITALTVLLALAGAALLAQGGPAVHWGAGLFVLARFLDHFDGELARLTAKSSSFGYYFDYAAGALSYAALFLGIGIGQFALLGWWAVALGTAGAASALVSLATNLALDRRQAEAEAPVAGGYPGLRGFELEDGIYLLAPITWFGGLPYFFTAAGIGATIYCAWTFWSLYGAAARN